MISRNFSGADKFARDAFGNDSEHYVTNEFAAVVNDSKTSEETTEDQEDASPTIENAIQGTLLKYANIFGRNLGYKSHSKIADFT